MSSLLLEKGERGIIIGQTGSGKTVGAISHLQNSSLYPVIIFDTKGEPAFDDIALDDEESVIFDSAKDFIDQWHRRKQPEYSIVRPTPEEMGDPLKLDNVLMQIYNTGKKCLIYIDECYQWHINGRAGNGLIGLLTRGRSKGMSVLMSTQRPAWISRFCFTEAQKFYIYKLTDKRDFKILGEYIPEIEGKKIGHKYHWLYYNYSDDQGIRYFKPVPMIVKQTTGNNTKGRWI